MQGFPTDPENSKASLALVKGGFDGTEEAAYYVLPPGDLRRTPARDAIIAKRLRGYDIAYSKFERQLLGTSDSLSVGTDLVGLALGGLTATVGGSGTKAALGAASTGVLGANAAVNKDLFYQKTIPALISQMDANRSKALLAIVKGMTLSADKYPLASAMADLNAYRDAGSIPNAISSITQAASADKEKSQEAITFVRAAGTEAQIPVKQGIAKQLKPLTDSQILAVVKAMDLNLTSRPAGLQQLVKTIDDTGTRETNPLKARQVVNAWVQEEDMTADAAAEWSAAMAAATK